MEEEKEEEYIKKNKEDSEAEGRNDRKAKRNEKKKHCKRKR